MTTKVMSFMWGKAVVSGFCLLFCWARDTNHGVCPNRPNQEPGAPSEDLSDSFTVGTTPQTHLTKNEIDVGFKT